jgi:hypothetical protein
MCKGKNPVSKDQVFQGKINWKGCKGCVGQEIAAAGKNSLTIREHF